MIVTFWLEGDQVGDEWLGYNQSYTPAVGDHIYLPTLPDPYVVSERWLAADDPSVSGVHVVLRRPETPAESTPPWKRKEEG